MFFQSSMELVILSFFIIIVLVFLLFFSIFRRLKNLFFVKFFSDYQAILQYYMDRSYDIVYKDRVLVYSLEAMKLPDDKFLEASRDFANLTIKLLGPRLEKDLIEFFGNRQTLLLNITNYFNLKYEEDEIRRGSLNNLTESED